MSWTVVAQSEPEREYLALVSYIPLRSIRKLPAFLRYSQAIRQQLNGSKGLVGYSLRASAGFLRRRFWTLSVWEDGQALSELVETIPHSEIMKALTPYMGKTQFVRWNLLGSAVPPDWQDAMKRLRAD